MSVTVLTPTIPGRENMLAECVASVNEQTVRAEAHLIRSSRPHGVGISHLTEQMNALLPAVTTEWVAVLADDDLALPNHIETAAPYFPDADVIYTWDAARFCPHVDCTGWSLSRLCDRLDVMNFIPATAFIRTASLRFVGGWPSDWIGDSWQNGGHFPDTVAFAEDWELWRRLARAEMRFRCVPVETWAYRPGRWPRLTTGL